MHKRTMTRAAAVLTIALTSALATAMSAGAHSTRLYYTLGVPAQDTVPQSQRLYAGLGGVGNGNRLGDPVVLATRAGVNPRQEWWMAPSTYPGYQGDVTGGHGIRWECFPFGRCFEGRDPHPTQKLRGKLVNRYSGKCLAVEGGGVVAHNNAVIQWTCERDARDQIWTVVVPKPLSPTKMYVVAPQPFANSHTCLGPSQRTAGTTVRIFGSPDICPHWMLQPTLRDHRYPQRFVNPF